MTRDAEKVLMKLYRVYKERRKTLSASQAKHFSSEDTESALSDILWDDAKEALSELRANGYIDLYMMGSCDLCPKALEYGETAGERTVEKVLDVWDKIH